MRISRFFIDRPIFAAVVALVITIIGGQDTPSKDSCPASLECGHLADDWPAIMIDW